MFHEEIKRFDINRKPKKQSPFLMPIIWGASFPANIFNRVKIKKLGMEGLKPPYLLLCNHNAFRDFLVAAEANFPHRANSVVAIDGFIGIEWLLRAVGGICTRKFVSDTTLVKQMKRVVQGGQIAVLYPEARYSLCGTNAVLPESLGKLAKFLGVPVAALVINGHHVAAPFWNRKRRNLSKTEAVMTKIIDKDELKALSVSEINERINASLVYDDFKWQRENGIIIDEPFRAEGLHKVLYKCPACNTEYKMDSKGTELFCKECGTRWEMTTLGELSAKEGETEFSHIPDWYEWERAEVRKEIEEGRYCFEADTEVEWLPNAKGFIKIGRARLVHNADGFLLKGSYGGEDYEVVRTTPSIYSCHIEYNYKKKGDCIDLNTSTDTFYIYPKDCDFSVTKIALATEELYFHYINNK
ncbi:MAG: hypothetical protein IJD95_05545 [Clostridia bacterium]|nr:hypothetical protein [Clostridia bacterium]